MKTVVSRSFIVAGLVGAGVLPLSSGGCSSDNTTGPGDGGSSSSGSGGGSSSSGGGSSGGSSSSSSGGSSSGTPHDGGEAGAPAINCTFDSAAQECTAPIPAPTWRLNPYADPNNLAAPPPVVDSGSGASEAGEAGNVGDGEAGSAGDAGEAGSAEGGSASEAGTVSDAGTSSGPTLTVSTMDGNPNPGSLKLTATFTNYNQFVEAILPFTQTLDLSTRMLSADIRLASVTGAATFPGGATLYTSTSGATYCYTPGGAVATFTPGTWVTLNQDLTTPMGSGCTADATLVPQIGVHFYANGAAAEAGAFPGPITAVFEIDNVIAQ